MITWAVAWLYSKIGYDPVMDVGFWMFCAIVADGVWLSILVYGLTT